jgi:hypothetical protein
MSGEYLVQHGAVGHLGRFRSGEGRGFRRGDAVVVRSRRGLELGDVLCHSSADGAVLPDPFVGELIRAATADDVAEAEQRHQLGRLVFEDAARHAEAIGLPLAVIDVEVLLDGRHVLLHAARLGPCDEAPFLAELGDRRGVIVRLYDVASEPVAGEDDSGCGSCGEGGCGEDGCRDCGHGCESCSSGGAAELAAYFSALREQMEQRHRVPLL